MDSMDDEQKKRAHLQKRLRRGKFMNTPYYRTEKERIQAENMMEQNEIDQQAVNYERACANFPKKFQISSCLSN